MEYFGENRLTARECEVLDLVSHGLSAKAIARRIAIAPRTVERHIDNVRLKVGGRNRAHMIARAWANGLLVITRSTHGVSAAL
ncbi:LuxR family transcriptional regulator [Sphingomonas cavernae]|uniref:LuxR family transcriptional regulator n=2 Tax=Sphingomonas cavernae TaxID=2320861 RepID=A0A418WMY7_9SPHN|nr:LuxR family transcriptional regulator [Sphingomonas cavernae]